MKRHKYLSIFFVFFIIAGVLFLPGLTSAQGSFEKSVFAGGIFIAIMKFFLWIASLALQLTVFFLKFFILLAGYNGYINADIVKFGWNIIRDVANMFFIVFLLIIAFGTILGLEQYEWKKSLPKLIFAAIFVNFSNVICQLIIDVSQVFTITFLNAVAGTAGGNLITMMNFQSVFTFTSNTLVETLVTDVEGDLIIGALLAMFFCITAAVVIGSYLIVMLYRVITLWCLIILSPLAFLFSALPSTKSYADEFWKEFINNVIAAPMMVFFLWLAFSTFGAGDVVTSNIEAYNSLQGYKLDSDANAIGSQTGIGISEAAEWINMANFAVAIAFLFVGLERVQKLGVKGGDYIQKAANFGLDIFKYAAGYYLGRRAFEGAGNASKFGLNKLPGIGGDSWRRRGRALASFAKIQGHEFNNSRDSFFSNLQKSKSVLGKGAGHLGMFLFGSSARSEKLAKNWEQAAESAFKEWDERVSTSKTMSGKSKLEYGVKAEIAEDLSAQKKRVKFAEQRERLLEGNGGKNPYDEMEKEQAKASAEADIFEHFQSERKRQGVAAAKNDLLDQHTVGKNQTNFHDVEHRTAQLKAQSNILEGKTEAREKKAEEEYKSLISAATDLPKGASEQLKKERAFYSGIALDEAAALADTEEAQKLVTRGLLKDTADARDAVRVKNKLPPIHREALEKKFLQEDMELIGASNFDRFQARVNNLTKKIRETSDDEEKQKMNEELKKMVAFGLTRGGPFGNVAISSITRDLTNKGSVNVAHMGADLDSESILNTQARVLSAVTNSVVDATPEAIDKALKDLTSDAEGRGITLMRTIKDGLEKSGEEGAVNHAGIFREKIDENDGSSSFVRLDMTKELDRNYVKGKRESAIGNASPDKILSFMGSIDSVRGSDGSEQMSIHSDAAKENLTKMFSRVTANSVDRIHEEVIGQWNNLIKTLEDTGADDQMEELLQRLSKSGDKEGLRKMFNRTKMQDSRFASMAKRFFDSSSNVQGSGSPRPPAGPSPFV